MVYYDKDNILVRFSTEEDVASMENRLRQEDIVECWSSHNHTPREALEVCIKKCLYSYTIVVDGLPVGIFAINPDNLLGDTAVIGLLTTTDLVKIKKRFLLNARKFIKTFLSRYSFLYNFVKEDNFGAIEFLKFCGANFEEPILYGSNNDRFIPFYFKAS